jgi:hypothetical protein
VRETKNIDRLFQEKLKDFEKYPGQGAWSAIEKELSPVSPKRRFRPWYRIASIAAVFLLLMGVGYRYEIPNTDFFEKMLANGPTESVVVETSPQEDSKPSNTLVETANIPEEIPVSSDISTSIAAVQEVSDDLSENNRLLKGQDRSDMGLDFAENPLFSTSPFTAPKTAPLSNRFSVATIFAPIYLSGVDNASLGTQLGNGTVATNLSYAYGLKVSYQLSKRISFQSGINLINMGYTANQVPFAATMASEGEPLTKSLPKNESLVSGKTNNQSVTNLNRVFGYVEIPVEVKYHLTEGRLGINLVGGFSTLLLNRDDIFLQNDFDKQDLNGLETLRSVNFTGNIGLDVDYSIRKNLYLNISPMFKLQTNAFSRNADNVLPYYIGVYTGVNYQF